MYAIIKKILFLLKPEKAHCFTVIILKIASKIPGTSFIIKYFFEYKKKDLEVEILGIKFKNPIGLAAGFDKNANYIKEISQFGFSHIEIGTVTPKPQIGNDKPRMFRLVQDEAIINRMGFNNYGVDYAVERLKKIKKKNIDCVIGGNIGKNKITPNEEAVNDYIICFNKLFDWVDYFAVNVSSPNTPGLRELQEKSHLLKILKELQSENFKKPTQKPIFLKIAPDLTNEQLDDIVDIVKETEIGGVIATNTTIGRTNLESSKNIISEFGGLSGRPLSKRSTEVIKYLSYKSKGSFPIIGVGGISSYQDVLIKLNAGASVVQMYSGFIFKGPSVVKSICKKLSNRKNQTE